MYDRNRDVHSIAPCDKLIAPKVPKKQRAFCSHDFPVQDDEAILKDICGVQTLVRDLNIRGIRLRVRGMFVAPSRIRTSGESHILHGIINRVPLTAKR